MRASLLMRDILPIIPPKANRREPNACRFHRYRDPQLHRAHVWIRQRQRRIANPIGKTAMSCRPSKSADGYEVVNKIWPRFRESAPYLPSFG